MKRDKTKNKEAHQQAEYKAPAFSPRLRAGGFLLAIAVFCWPILYLFGHVFPVNGQYTMIGNDFLTLYYKYKVYLLASLADFRFPLWSPSEAAGFPFYTSPFAQVFYPFNALLVVWYKIFGGYSPADHQLFTVLGISIFALGLFMWLRLVNSNTRAVVFATLVMSVSFKVTELVRFPNAVHSAAWYPWVLYALTRIMFSGSIKEAVKAGALLILFGVCLCTAGYPYYVYYAVFLFLPYLLAFLVKPLRARLFGEREVSLKRALMTLAAAGLVTLLLCGPYLMSILQLMSQTIDRAGRDFRYSTSHIFSFEDTVGSLVYPPASSTEGVVFLQYHGTIDNRSLSVWPAGHNRRQRRRWAGDNAGGCRKLVGETVFRHLDWANQLHQLWAIFVSFRPALELYARLFKLARLGPVEYNPCADIGVAAVDSVLAFYTDDWQQGQGSRRAAQGGCGDGRSCDRLCIRARLAALSAFGGYQGPDVEAVFHPRGGK